MKGKTLDLDEDLRDEPEISLAVAMGDHNFSDLKKFALARDGNLTVSGNNTKDISENATYPQAMTTAQTVNHSSQSAFSLSHILNPIPTDPDKPEGHHMCPSLDELSSTIEHIDAPQPDADAMMMLDLLPSDTALGDVEELQKEDMQVDGEDDKREIPNRKQSGLLGWLKLGAVKKRTRVDAEMSSDESDSASRKSSMGRKNIAKKLKSVIGATSGPGLSRSATASRALRQSVRSGKFHPDLRKLERWMADIWQIDKDAEVNSKTAQEVRHSTCGRWYKMKEPYDTYRFRKHVNEECYSLPRVASAGMPTVTQWHKKFNVDVYNTKNSTPPQRQFPCPGLTAKDDTRVILYLERTGATGGGARSITAIARERFNKLFSKLSKKRKQEVLDTQIHEHTWRNDHDHDRVFAHNCLKQVMGADNSDRVLPCTNCHGLLRNSRFQQALRKPRPKDENFIHINKRWRPPGKLVHLFGRISGLREIVEESVRIISFNT